MIQSVKSWYLPRDHEEAVGTAWVLGLNLGWDLCRLLGDQHVGLAAWDFMGTVLFVTGYILIVRRLK